MDNEKKTPLHRAATHPAAIRALVGPSKTVIDALDKRGNSALMIAAAAGAAEVVVALRSAGARSNQKDQQGLGPVRGSHTWRKKP